MVDSFKTSTDLLKDIIQIDLDRILSTEGRRLSIPEPEVECEAQPVEETRRETEAADDESEQDDSAVFSDNVGRVFSSEDGTLHIFFNDMQQLSIDSMGYGIQVKDSKGQIASYPLGCSTANPKSDCLSSKDVL